MAAEEDIAIIMHRFYGDTCLAQNVAAVPAACTPKRIEDNLDARLRDCLQIDEFRESFEKALFHISGFEFVDRLFRDRHSLVADCGNRSLNLFRHLGQCRRSIMCRELDAVVLGRIVRSGEVDRSRHLHLPHGVSDGGCWRSFRNDDRCYARGGQNTRSFSHKGLAEEAGIAAYQYAMGRRLRLYISGDTCNRKANISQRELIGHNGSPPRCTKMNAFAHRSLHLPPVGPQRPYCITTPATASYGNHTRRRLWSSSNRFHVDCDGKKPCPIVLLQPALF